MRILAISDEPSPKLWGEHCRDALAGVDLILSAGDLPSSYLSFLTCFTNAPVIYVHGNHDDHYEQKPPEGCLCADGTPICILKRKWPRGSPPCAGKSAQPAALTSC